ncbi:uncharacterized protein adgrg2a [Polymixia lowei]
MWQMEAFLAGTQGRMYISELLISSEHLDTSSQTRTALFVIMCGLHLGRQRRHRHRVLTVIWLWLLLGPAATVLGYFMGDTKAALRRCTDHWTLQDRAAMPLLFQMTVCVQIRVAVPGAWVAFSYSSAHAPRPELGLEGDDSALYGWLLGVRHRFPLRLSPTNWHGVCLRRDVPGNSFSLEVDGQVVAERTVIAQAISPSGSLRLGCRPRDRPPGAVVGEVELYLFRMWADLSDHAPCEDGSVIGWDSRFWGITSAKARQRDPGLLCGSPLMNCDINQLCSNDVAYYWLFISWEASTAYRTKRDVQQRAAQLECQGQNGRLDSCTVILQMSGSVDVCSLDEVLRRHLDDRITVHEPLTHMVLCGSPSMSASALLKSNLTWVAVNLSFTEICQPNHSLLSCKADETLGVLLTDSCPNSASYMIRNATTTQGDHNINGTTTSPNNTTVLLNNVTTAANNGTLQTSKSTPRNATLNTTTTSPSYTTTADNVTAVDINRTLQDGASPQADNVTTADDNRTLQDKVSPQAYSQMTTSNTGEKTNYTATSASYNFTTATAPNDADSTAVTPAASINHVLSPNTTAETNVDLDATASANVTDANPVAKETTRNSPEEQEQEAEQLLDQTQNATKLNSTQVEQVVEKLEKLLEGPSISQSVGQKAINVISNLMEGESLAISTSANRLIRAVDDLGLKLDVSEEIEVVSSNTLALVVMTVDGTNFQAASLSIFDHAGLQASVTGGSQSRSSGTILASAFLPSSLTEGLSPEEQRQASRVQFTLYTSSSLFQDAALSTTTIVSPVLGSSVANLSISNLSENIRFTIRNAEPTPANYVASCVFWDFSLTGGGGGWNPDGCFVVNSTEENTTCSCNHLTSFAILMDLSREGIIDRQQATVLTFVTYIGCGISAIFLFVTLLTYLSFQKLLRDIPAKILVQLCLSLLFLNLLFLLDSWLALYSSTELCISTGFFLHYFLLTSFTWAGLEALHMYLSIVKVFTPYLSRYMLKFSLLGWGLPLIVVIVVISVDKDNYGLVEYGKYSDGTSDDFCWLRKDLAFYVGVVAYFLLIFASSLLVFIVVLVQLARIKRQNPQNRSPQRGLMTDLRSIAGLVILLGLTWGFALFAWGPLYLPFVYLFSIFNTLQGFFIFVFHCAFKENVRRQWRTYLCCGRLRLAENSEWSRTATHNPKTLTVTMASTSALNPASRSSSLISDATNSSGSVFADSGISDGSSGDVILNEMHRRTAVTRDSA